MGRLARRRLARSQATGVGARASAFMKYVSSKTKLQKHLRIHILDEGPTLPDIDHDAIGALAGLDEAVAHPGWPVSLPGDLLVSIAPVMMVMAKLLPLIVKVATGLTLPDLGMGTDVGSASMQIAALSAARGRVCFASFKTGFCFARFIPLTIRNSKRP